MLIDICFQLEEKKNEVYLIRKLYRNVIGIIFGHFQIIRKLESELIE